MLNFLILKMGVPVFIGAILDVMLSFVKPLMYKSTDTSAYSGM